MKNNHLFAIAISLLFLSTLQSQTTSESGKLGVGVASNFPGYGLSAKYNFTETHTGQFIIGGASYGFGTNSIALTGRYLYNFEAKGDSFVYKPYVYGQVGYFSVKFDFLGESASSNTISFGVGGGIECTIPDFVDGLAFNAELGYVTFNTYEKDYSNSYGFIFNDL